MGCNQSQPKQPVTNPRLEADASGKSVQDKTPPGPVRIYGAPVSMNALGPIIMVEAKNCGKMELTIPGPATNTPEFLAMNPFHAIPTLKDGDYSLAESNAILRYIAVTYAPEFYSKDDKRRGYIDWSMDAFSTTLVMATKTILPCIGFAPAPPNQAEVGKQCTQALADFASVFLKEKFIGGDKVSIADVKIAPFFKAFSHPMIKSQAGVDIPNRIKQFNTDFAEAVPTSVQSLAGFVAFLDEKNGSPAKLLTEFTTEMIVDDIIAPKRTAGKGYVQVVGAPPDANCVGPIMFAKHTKIGDMKLCLSKNSSHTESLADSNPLKTVPTLKDGDFCMGGSNEVLRYMACTYAKEYYPEDPKVRGHIDWAMDRFSSASYSHAVATINAVMGLNETPSSDDELLAAGKKAMDSMTEWADKFLTNKFIAGDKLSIADFKAAPFFFAWNHPQLKNKCGIELPVKIATYLEQFRKECKSYDFLENSGGFAIKELLDDAGSPTAQQAAIRASLQGVVAPAPEVVELINPDAAMCGACVVM